MERLRIKPSEMHIVADIGTLLALLGDTTETPSAIAHQALTDGLNNRKRKLAAIVSNMSNRNTK